MAGLSPSASTHATSLRRDEHHMRASKLVLILALLLGASTFGAAQWRNGNGGWGNGNNRGNNGSWNNGRRSHSYQEGFHDGQRDRLRGHGYRPHPDGDDDRGAYNNGYRAGYQYGRDGDNDADD